MRLYSFQDEQAVKAIENLDDDSFMYSDFGKSHLYLNGGPNKEIMFEAYRWMAEKLAAKTGILMDSKVGEIPPMPWWAWYKVDGENREPDPDYEMTSWGREDFSKVKTYLLTLEVPDDMVLLSDINAFYCCLNGKPCFDYLSEEDEEKALDDFERKSEEFMKTHDQALGEELEKIIYDSWENVFIVDGSRRLKTIETGVAFFPVIEEKNDVQAAFPIMAKRFIKDMKVVHEG